MTCTGYLPVFQPQLQSGYALGGLSCTCFAGAMAGQYDTCGAKLPTGRQVRYLTGDTDGGTTLLQVDAALRKGYGIDLDTRIGTAALTWAQFSAYINAGRGAVLQGGYAPINDSRFQGSETFRGNHAIAVFPGWVAMDPLADGRRPGIYKYHGEAYPESLLRAFASQLDLGNGSKSGMRVWCGLTRDNATTWKAGIHPTTRTRFWVYTIHDGVITGRTVDATAGFSANCTPPRAYRWPGSSVVSKSLVQLTSGSRRDRYIESRYAKEYP
jgi:hypothetical protein